MLSKGASVGVVGAGVSGLAFAHYLARLRPDVHLTLYDAAKRAGGYINSQTHNVNGSPVLLEKGPRTLRGASDGTVLIADALISLGDHQRLKVIPSKSISNKKWLLSPDGELTQVPSDLQSFREFLKSPLGKGLVSGFLKEPFQSKKDLDDESVASFLTRRFGASLPTNVISAVFHGVYAADIHKLSAKTTLKSMFDAEKSHGSVIKSMLSKVFQKKKAQPSQLSELLQDYESKFPSQDYTLEHLSTILKKYPMITVTGGLESLTKALYNSLSQCPNVDFKLETPVNSIKTTPNEVMINGTSYDHIHTTISASHLSKTLPQGSAAASIAKELTYIDINMINIYVPSSILKHTGFGYLVPRAHSNPHHILGVIFDSDVEKGSIALFQDLKDLQGGALPELGSEYNEQDYTKLTIMMGGHYWSESGKPKDIEAVTSNAIREVESHLGVKFDEKCYIDQTCIPQCLPQYHVGYESMKQDFTKAIGAEFKGKLTFGGMSFGDGAGVPDCVSNAYKTAASLASSGNRV